MERELWKLLYVLAQEVDKSWGNWLYTASDVLAIYFWAVVHDRPTSWATDPAQWPDDLRPRRMPTQSTVSRRLRKPETVALMTEMEDCLLALVGVAGCLVQSIDGKPLTVSNVSKDADASFGRGAGGLQKGYKLHAVWGRSPIPIAWALTPMNVSEKKMARSLIPTLPGGGYLLADGNYDANYLYDLAAKQGYQLVAKKRKSRSGGVGHRRQSPSRMRSIAILRKPFGRDLYKERNSIERQFGTLSCCSAIGLGPLPAWVRRFTRVRNWVQAKLLAAAAHWLVNHQYVLADA